MNNKGAVAEEGAHAFLERDERVGVRSFETRPIHFAVLTSEIADLTCIWSVHGARWRLASNEWIQVA